MIFGRRSILRSIKAVPAVPEQIFRGALDFPSAGQECWGQVEIAGWIYSRSGTIVRIEVSIGDVILDNLQNGLSRPDVAAAFPGKVPEACGFKKSVLITSNVSGGSQNVRVNARDER